MWWYDYRGTCSVTHKLPLLADLLSLMTSKHRRPQREFSPHRGTCILFFPDGAAPTTGPSHPRYRGFTITLRHTTLGRTPLDERSARRRDLYLATYNTHKKETSMSPAGF
jgi:hypothetical protein